ncbi:MAG: hypothetical protein KC613_11310 [Myxococcales bacterium]|nr:hypothetical protein [Myxococcales bacterium]
MRVTQAAPMRGAGLLGLLTRCALALTVCLPSAWAHSEGPPPPKAGPKRGTFEFSMASAHPFPAEHIGRYDDDVDIVPPTSVMLLLEYFLSPAWRTRFFYDLSLTTDKRIIAGEVTEKVIPSKLGLGLTWAPWRWQVLHRSRVELQGTLWAGMVLEEPVEFFPMWTGRVHLMQDADTGVGIYLGVMYAFLLNKAGPFYGVSYRF